MQATLNVIEAGPRRLRRPAGSTPAVDLQRDPWAELSADLVARFVDVMEVEYGLSRGMRRCYRSELTALDDWMRRTRGRTLAAARRAELLAYLRAQFMTGMKVREGERLLMCLQHFYRYMKEGGYRPDNAAARLCSGLRRNARAVSGHELLRFAG